MFDNVVLCNSSLMLILSSVFNVLNNNNSQTKISAELGELDPPSPTFIKTIFNSNRDFPYPQVAVTTQS